MHHNLPIANPTSKRQIYQSQQHMLLEPNTDLSPIHWHLMETKIIKCFILSWLSRQGVVTKANVQRFSSGLSFKSCITWERFPKRSEKWKCCLIFNTITIFPWIHRNIIMMVIGLALQRSVLVQLDVSYTYSVFFVVHNIWWISSIMTKWTVCELTGAEVHHWVWLVRDVMVGLRGERGGQKWEP